jgi:hypothetical protein
MAPLARRIRKRAVRPVPKQDGDVLAEAPADDPSVAVAAPASGGNAALALAYADRGVRVFPCREDRFGVSEEHPKGDPEAKAPYGGVMWKGSEPGKRTSVAAWWRNWSGALIGVDIGALRILVADVDGADAIALWEAYAGEHGGLPDGVPYVNTPTGGRHYFFRLPVGVKHGNGRGSLPPKAELPVDIRGIGGYVIAAGTERPYWGRYEPHDGDHFSWLDAPEIPAWLLTVLKGEREHDGQPRATLPAIVPSSPVTIENPRVSAWAEEAFEQEITAVATCGEGGRNNQLNASAYALGQIIGAKCLDEGRVRAALEQASRENGYIRNKGVRAARKTINSGITKGKRDPRPIPADIIEDEAEAEAGRAIRLRLAAKWQNAKAAANALVPHDPETGEVLDEPEPEDAPLPAKPEEEEFPEEWTYVPGLVGEITDWITATARRPNRAMSLAAAVAVVGAVMGRCWAGPTKSATHNYILTIARTGGGKDHPKQQAHTILDTCGMGETIGPDGFTASTALTSLLLRTPVSLSAIDEFGTFLKRINGRRAGGFEKEISKVLRTAWGVNFKSMRTPEWAGKPSQTIYAPALTIMGTTTASEFFKSLEGGDIGNGFLNRFMLIYVTTKPQEVEPELPDNVVPDHIKQGVDDLWGCGNEDYRSTVFRSSADEVNPTIIPWEDEAAHAVYKLLGKTIELMGDEQPETVDFFARTAEMAVRLATIRAAGRFPYGPKVSVEDMKWGREVAWWSARRMMECCALYMAETENQEWANTIKRIIRDAGGKMSKSGMLRKLQHKMKARDLNELLGLMKESGTIKIVTEKSNGGAPPVMIQLLD